MHPYPGFVATRGFTSAAAILFLLLAVFPAIPARAQQQAALGTDSASQIVDYLLGKTSDDTGLDLNGDSQVNVTDLVFSITHRVPVVSSFAIANGAASTGSRTVTLNNTCINIPVYYMASESSSFSGAAWQPYAAAPTFTLTAGNLARTVYFKVKTAYGVESPVVSDTITLNEIITLAVGASAVGGAINPAGDTDWYQFTVGAASTYVIETWPGTLTANVMRLYGPGNMSTYITKDQNSSVYGMARIALTLAPGTYYTKVQALDVAGSGSYTIKVSNIGALKVSAFSLSAGAGLTTQRTVTMNNSCVGAPVSYLASESADFSGAAWKVYTAAPSFTLSAGNLAKRVYFKVKDAGGTESAVVSDTITLAETGALTVGAASVTGNISPAGEADWWRFSVDAASTFVIETWPGTLADNTMALYGPDTMAALVASDDNSGTGNAARLALTLKSGTYYVKIQAATPAAGDYTIRVVNLGALKVNSFAINGGASLATNRTVTLNNTCAGAPTQFMASESSSFSGAAWQTYAAAPAFALSSGNVTKQVFFKVRDLSGTQSPVLSDTITLKEMTTLPPDGTVVNGNLTVSGAENWYVLTIPTTGLYNIQTYAGSLADTILSVADIPNPASDEWFIVNDNIDDSDLMSHVTAWLTAGVYYVRVQSGDLSAGNYTIRAWPQQFKTLSVNGSTVSGNISSLEDEDWFQFTITSGGLYSIESQAGELDDGFLALYSGAFDLIAYNNDATGIAAGTMPAITADLAPGTYIMGMIAVSAADTGSFSIKVRSGAISGGTVSLMINGPTMGSVISAPDSSGTTDTDWYQLVINDSGAYTITTTAGSLLTAYMVLYDPNGNAIAEGGSENAGEMPEFKNLTLAPGYYELSVQGYFTTDSGSYKIRLTR